VSKSASIFFAIALTISSFVADAQSRDSLAINADFVVRDIMIAGNRTTKDFVVRRELLFTEGDTLKADDAAAVLLRSKENLLNTSLFNYVTINLIDLNEHEKQVLVMLEERWYWWPYIIFEQADRNLSAFFNDGDWSRINYGLMLINNNFRGRAETLKVKFRLGYKKQFQVLYDIPYFTANKKHGLAVQLSFYRQNEVRFATDSCKPQYFRDDKHQVIDNQDLFLFYTFRPKFDVRHIFTAGYANANVADTIIALNPDYFGTQTSRTQYFKLSYIFDWDTRDYKFYPLKGHNVTLELGKIGLNLLDNELDGSWYTRLSAYKYFDLGHRFYAGFGGLAKYSPDKPQPYYTEQALGYLDYLRGFEYYVIDGQRFATGRAFAKFALVPMRIKKIDSWSWDEFNKVHYSFYLNLFVDAGYVDDSRIGTNNYLSNKLLTSAGIGLDMITYYDIVFRLEGTLSRQGKSGLYVHVLKAF
jgi:outer membrane protein assembly factor BamA